VDAITLAVGIPESWIERFQIELIGRLFLAAVLGGAIGLERELSGKAAGLRTNLLICVGATLLTELSIRMATFGAVETVTGDIVRADPTRIAAQIVSGIGFLGAGTIIQSRGAVRGLTTAATIWVVAGIGMAVGSRAYMVAIASTALVAFTLVLLGKVEDAMDRRRGRRSYVLSLDPAPDVVGELEGLIESSGLKLRTSSVTKSDDEFEVRYQIEGSRDAHRALSSHFLVHDRVRRSSSVQ
jgi:putative Mg2+ transporter-C (MgtC) family protein